MKRYLKSSETSDFIRKNQMMPKDGYLYIFKHGIGPGTIPSDVSVVKVQDLPNNYTAVWLDRWLTTSELKQYDIPSETDINYYLKRIGYCQKEGSVVPCDDVRACKDIKAASGSRRCQNVTKEVLDYLATNYPDSNLYKELTDKDIWINLWYDGEYSLSYNSVKNPETFLTDASTDELVKVMSELYPDSYFGDVVASTSTKYTADMCSIGASEDEDGFEQQVEYTEPDSDEYIEGGKFYVAGYLSSNYRGLMSDLYSDDFEEILSTAADMAGQGLFVEITNRADGRSERYTPEDFEIAAENGEYPDHIREDLAL